MATIVFVAYPEAGHLNPSFKIARSLKRRGHRVCYLGILDLEEQVRAQGLEFIPILQGLYPKGFLREEAQNKKIDNIEALAAGIKQARLGGGADPIKDLIASLRAVEPDLVIIDVLLPYLALIMSKLGLPLVFLNIILFKPWEHTDLYKPLLSVPELILCPEAFDFPHATEPGRRFYIEASIDLERKEPDFDWELIDDRKPLVYCSLGSQSHLYDHSEKFFQATIDAMKIRTDLQMIMSVGTRADAGHFGAAPENLVIVNSAPQLEVLKRASLMITHGGLGSIKECIFFGVPMVVFPVMREQPMNAARIVYHGLGARGNIRTSSAGQVLSLIKSVENNPTVGRRMDAMRKEFKEIEGFPKGIKIIETLLSSKSLQDRSTPARVAPGL